MKISVKLAVICCTAALLASGCVTSGSHTLSITEALNSKEAKVSLDPSIKLEFAAGKGTVLRDGQVSNNLYFWGWGLGGVVGECWWVEELFHCLCWDHVGGGVDSAAVVVRFDPLAGFYFGL